MKVKDYYTFAPILQSLIRKGGKWEEKVRVLSEEGKNFLCFCIATGLEALADSKAASDIRPSLVGKKKELRYLASFPNLSKKNQSKTKRERIIHLCSSEICCVLRPALTAYNSKLHKLAKSHKPVKKGAKKQKSRKTNKTSA